MDRIPALSGVILAGGRGQRFGGQDKGWLRYQGRSLIEHQLERIGPQVAQLLISANRHLPEYRALGIPVLEDSIPGFAGPLAGILASLQRMQHDWLLVVSCDSPHLPDTLAQKLWQGRAGQSIAYAVTAERAHFLAALIARDRLASLQQYLASGQRRVGDWYRQQQAQACLFEQSDAFINLNEPEDLAVWSPVSDR